MMVNQAQQNTIIRIIHQDLKHNQLIKGLRDLGFDDSGIYTLDLLTTVAEMMGIPEEEIPDQWVTIYWKQMEKAIEFKVSDLGEELKPLAEKCYSLLVACAEGHEISGKKD